MVKVHNFFDGIVGKITDDHSEQKRRALEEKREWTKDILDVLLDISESQTLEVEFTKENIKGVLFDLFVAGMETTATSMEWVITALIKHPWVAKKLQEEIDSIVGKERMEFDMLPFGTGRRGCPGWHMAIGQISFVLPQLWHCFDWRLEGDPADLDMDEEIGLTVARKNHLFAIPSRKLSTSF
ncbi:hypothetical protein SUGI_0347970 [Cryptomeria japonica]|nr:hypothetical protein SUGI_0347970 [Cryptomeria japonica]